MGIFLKYKQTYVNNCPKEQHNFSPKEYQLLKNFFLWTLSFLNCLYARDLIVDRGIKHYSFIFLTRCWLGKPHSNHISRNRARVWDSPHFLIEKIEKYLGPLLILFKKKFSPKNSTFWCILYQLYCSTIKYVVCCVWCWLWSCRRHLTGVF